MGWGHAPDPEDDVTELVRFVGAFLIGIEPDRLEVGQCRRMLFEDGVNRRVQMLAQMTNERAGKLPAAKPGNGDERLFPLTSGLLTGEVEEGQQTPLIQRPVTGHINLMSLRHRLPVGRYPTAIIAQEGAGRKK